MKIAYLIMAHNTPNHLRRLLAALSSESSCFFIHVDKKTSDNAFGELEGRNISFTHERVPVYWGDFSQIEATLLLTRTALADQNRFDRFVLLSGADFPLRSALYIKQFFQRNHNKEYIDLVAMPSKEFGKPISRLTTYKLRPGDGMISNMMRKVLLFIGALPKRRDYKLFLGNLAPYAGSQWWALTREACDYLIDFVNKNNELVDFIKNTIVPDESFFHTILGNSHFKQKIMGSVTYADWSTGGSSPAYISEKHLLFFKSKSTNKLESENSGREMLFARKFPDESKGLVEKIKEQIHNNP